MKKSLVIALVIALAGLFVSTNGFAASFTISPSSATAPLSGGPTSPADILVNYDPEGGTADGIEVEVDFDDTAFDLTVSGSCAYTAGTGTVIVIANDSFGNTLPAGTYCTMNFVSTVAAMEQAYPLTLQNALLFDGGVQQPAPTLNDGEIVVQSAPPDVTLSYTPTPGTTVNFTGGTGVAGSTSTASITATAGGTNGTATVTACGFSGGNAGAFALTSGDLSIVAGASDTIDMTCTRALTAQSSTLTCTENDSDSTDTPRSWPVSCPVGTPVPTPEYSSVPAPGGTIDCSGAPASTTTGTLTITNTGITGTGSDLTYSCTEPPTANFTITSGGSGTVTVGNTAQVQIQCLTPATAGDPDNTDTLACTTNDTGGTDGVDESSVSYDLVAGVLTAPPPEREASVIPVNSLWSKLMLIGLLLGLGGVALSLRRH